jgi:hypothetical protein
MTARLHPIARRALFAALAIGGVVLVVISDPRSSASYCGGRTEVETLSDHDQSKVDLTPIATGIERLRALHRPHLIQLSGRRGPVETTTFSFRARLLAMKRRPRNGIAVVVAQPSARQQTMIIGFEHPCGGWQTRKETDLMKRAKAALVAACGLPPAGRERAALTGEAEVSGVGFFGPRGRADAAPNGIELHPALSFKPLGCHRRRSVPSDGSGKKAARRLQAKTYAPASGRS